MSTDKKDSENRPLDFVTLSLASRLDWAKLSPKNAHMALMLCFGCAQELNGGLLKNARNWSKSEWIMRTFLTEKPKGDCPGFWHWEGDDLRVDAYDTERESRVLSRRKQASEAGKRGMMQRWNTVTDDITTDITNDIADSITSKSKRERKKEFDDDDDTAQARRPETINEIVDFLREQSTMLNEEQRAECARDFWALNEDTDWGNKNGDPIRNWKAAVTNYVTKWQQRAKQPQPRSAKIPPVQTVQGKSKWKKDL